MNDKTLLITLSSISILTTLAGSVFANQIRGVPCLLTDKERPWFDRWTRHAIGGVCGMGVVTGILMVLLIGIQLYFLVNLDIEDKTTIFWIKWSTLVIMILYFVIQFMLNSYTSHKIRGYTSIGLWEYMIPTYLLQGYILYILFKL